MSVSSGASSRTFVIVMDNDSESLLLRKAKGKPVIGWSTFMVLIVVFILSVLALALGIWMGLRMSWMRSHTYVHAVQDDSLFTVQPAVVAPNVRPRLLHYRRVEMYLY